MSVVRRFLVAPSLVRLIRKERGGARVTEGYFAPQGGRTSFVRVEGADCHLVLVSTDAEGRTKEERTEVPRAHGDALLDVCSGKAAYERTTVPIGGREALVDRYVTPGGLDIISVAFDDAGAAQGFAPPAWFGSEVSSDPAYERHAVAITGVPAATEIGLSNAALDAVLDLIEPRFGFGSLRKPMGSETRPEPAAPTPAPRPVAAVAEPIPAVAPAPPEPPKPATEATVAEASPALPDAPLSAPEEPSPPSAGPETPSEAAAAVQPPVEAKPEPKPEPKPAEDKVDARIDDVIESLSAALSAAIQQPREPAQEEDGTGGFERWTVRPRRTNQQG